MLPQERFAFEYLYKGNRLKIVPVSRETDVKSLMESCHLKYRKGKNMGDLREAFWGAGSMSK